MRTSVRAYMHHEGHRLHLYRRWGTEPGVSEVLKDTRVEAILGQQLLECAHRVRYVTAVHIYAVLGTNTIDLE